MAAPYTNADGLQVSTGDFQKDPKNFVNVPRAVVTAGAIKQIVIDVDLTKIASGSVTYSSDLNNDGTRDGFNTGDCYLPAYSSVLSCIYVAKTAAAGGTSIKLGTFQLTGAAIDDDFLMTATEGVKANLDTIGARTYGAGVGVATSVETASVGGDDAYLAITGAGTWTAGTGRFIIQYITPLADA